MTPKERASLAEQLLSNPIFAELLTSLERSAVEAMVHAADDETRARQAMRVKDLRSMRGECESFLRAVAPRRAPPV